MSRLARKPVVHSTVAPIQSAANRVRLSWFRLSPRLRQALLLVLVVGLAILAWEELFKDRVRPRNWGTVEADAIYRSGRLPLWRARQTLEQHQIQVIADLTLADGDTPAHQAETTAVRELGIERHRFSLQGDGTGDIQQYADALAVVHRSRQGHKPVLVHCAGGAQRTGGTIAFYRLLIQKEQPEEVYAEIQRYARTQPTAILINYINSHMGELAELLVQRGVLERIPDPLPQLPSRL